MILSTKQMINILFKITAHKILSPQLEKRLIALQQLAQIAEDYPELYDNVIQIITEFIKKENPRPIGLCGLMFPCLEDFELAEAYERGDFDLERNLFLSLHSGLGIDTYPIAINESPERVLDILRLLIGLSNKYKKPLSARFISDGKAKIGEMTKFGNQYLKNVILRKL